MSSLTLKLIACAAMLLDHIGYITGFSFLRMIGRIAFPLYLYLLVQGYRHTSSPLRYALRLGLFALISQIPFSLLESNALWGEKGNVYFTLLAALCCIWAADKMLKNKILRWFFWLPAALVFGIYHLGLIRTDYGAKGILMAMVFFLLDGKQLHKRILIVIAYLAAVFYSPILSMLLGLVRGQGLIFPTLSDWQITQFWSVFAFAFIFCYNGQKGRLPESVPARKALQYGFYLFYPLHLLVLWGIRFFL